MEPRATRGCEERATTSQLTATGRLMVTDWLAVGSASQPPLEGARRQLVAALLDDPLTVARQKVLH